MVWLARLALERGEVDQAKDLLRSIPNPTTEAYNLTQALARARSERGMELVKRIRAYYQQPNIDIGGILGVFGAAGLTPPAVADAIVYMAGLPLDANVQFMTVMATGMPLIGRG